MSERTAFPDGILLPDDPAIPLTREQFDSLFSDHAANAVVGRHILRLGRHAYRASLTSPIPDDSNSTREIAHAEK